MNTEKLRLLFIFILFACLCSFPLFYNLGKLSTLMWDESRNGINALEMMYDHHFIVTHFEGQPDMYNTKPPFFIWMAALCMKLFGTTVFSLRLPSAMAGFIISIYTFWFSKNYLKDFLPGFFSGLVLVTSVGFIDFHVTRNGDFDATLSMFIFFYCTQFFIYLETRERKHLLLASLFLGGAILTKGIAGCLFLPGLFIFIIINKKYHSVFKKTEFYLLTLSGILIGLSYYFLREMYNPGYIKAVIGNELTGRYLQANEGHSGDAWFYLQLLYDYHFPAWLYWIPIAIVIVFITPDTQFKKLGSFLTVQAILFLFIISVSKTKLYWYDAPIFPFTAFLIGLAIAQLYNGLKKKYFSTNRWLQATLFTLLCTALFYEPVQYLYRTSIFREKEADYNACLFGDFLNDSFFLFPDQHSLKILSVGYNPHLLFYTKIYQHQGHVITIIKPNSKISKRDTLMLCDTNLWPKLRTSYLLDTLYQEGDYKFILTVADSGNLSDPFKIAEKKFYKTIGSIENSPEWFSNIKKSSEKTSIDLKKQIMLNAFWLLCQDKSISPEVQGYLKKKYTL